jgi:glycosyltransferase involved in cell wall biosynthesis
MNQNNTVNIIENNGINTVSVIIATYRRDESLKRALGSIVNQTYNFIEVVVVDDNADVKWNNTVENIIKGFSSNLSIQYIQNKVNKGSAETRNVGIAASRGEYITFLDDDDIYLPNKISNQIKYMLANNSDFSITDLYLYDEQGKLIEKRIRNYIKDNSKEYLLKYHLKYHMTGTDTMMFKKDYLLKIGSFPPINVGDEFYLMQNAIENGGRFSYLNECDLKAFIHTSSEGLSSGDSKIKGENALYSYKQTYFDKLTNNDKRYITMRHYAVLAFAEIRRKNYKGFIKHSIMSFYSAPLDCVLLFFKRR